MTENMNTIENINIDSKKGKSIGARIGYFFLSWTPLAVSLLLQIGIAIVYILVASPGVGSVILYHVLSIPIFGLWYYFGCRRPKIKQSFQHLSVQAVVIAALGGVVMSLMANGIVGMQQYMIPDVVEEYVEIMDSVQMDTNILMILTSIILAPVGEEILCRGIILYSGEKALQKFWMANIMQALMFGIMHYNWVQGIYAFFIGLFLGYLKKRYRSIVPCMTLHLVVNLLSALGLGVVFTLLPESFFTYLGATILTAIASLVMVRYTSLRIT